MFLLFNFLTFGCKLKKKLKPSSKHLNEKHGTIEINCGSYYRRCLLLSAEPIIQGDTHFTHQSEKFIKDDVAYRKRYL